MLLFFIYNKNLIIMNCGNVENSWVCPRELNLWITLWITLRCPQVVVTMSSTVYNCPQLSTCYLLAMSTSPILALGVDVYNPSLVSTHVHTTLSQSSKIGIVWRASVSQGNPEHSDRDWLWVESYTPIVVVMCRCIYRQGQTPCNLLYGVYG